jgi:hypothetical protein
MPRLSVQGFVIGHSPCSVPINTGTCNFDDDFVPVLQRNSSGCRLIDCGDIHLLNWYIQIVYNLIGMPLLFIVGQIHHFRVVMPYRLARCLIHPYIGMD